MVLRNLSRSIHEITVKVRILSIFSKAEEEEEHMAQLAAAAVGRSGWIIGDYAVGRKIGSGSFSVVWEGRHLVDGTVVAIKEIAMARLSKKLQDSLKF
ncbi:hypothetical protein F2Q69_00041490 [Brassica cretica]|uniref:Protein kinase domain-containing protein n=1 Tax=Brassica cretica TaxID=69181 RepID=A0A8S9NAR1_BRACR|nr:hypothetical protein F2Q69_00041490 [Brassica cretica]